jgi:ActR/RegA family two-component response regulator
MLLVDDDDFIALALREQLTHLGWFAHSARTIGSALAMIRDGNYSCVCIDLHLTGSTTDECLNLIERVRLVLPSAVVLGTTAYPSADLELRAIASGADGVLHKRRDVRAVAEELQSTCRSMRGAFRQSCSEGA